MPALRFSRRTMHYLNRLEGIKRAKRVVRANPIWKNSFKILIKTRHPCSCDMCARDRNVIGKTQQEKKMDLEMEREHHYSKKKKKNVIVEYKFVGDPDSFWAELYPKDWKKWHGYSTMRGAKDVVQRMTRKYKKSGLIFRLKPEEGNNEENKG